MWPFYFADVAIKREESSSFLEKTALAYNFLRIF